MANSGITWGKPLIEFGLTGAEDAAPSSFKTMPTAEENTVLDVYKRQGEGCYQCR